MGNKNDKAYCTIAIAAANVIVFLYLSFGGMTENGEYMLAHGAMYVPYILENGEYYRLLTSIFLHFGFQHLFNNMVMLLMIGWNLELEMGRVRYVITYFVSGLAGNILSGFLDIRLQDFAVSAGASGAIFGITGALLYVVDVYKRQVQRFMCRCSRIGSELLKCSSLKKSCICLDMMMSERSFRKRRACDDPGRTASCQDHGRA